MEGFPERLIKIRKKRGLLQKELAEKIGVKPTRLNTWEGGTREPNLEMFRRIVAALKVNPNYLLCLSDNPEAENDDTFDKYVHLDTEDKAEIRGEIKQMLKAEKYKTRDAPTVAEDAADTIATAAEVFSGGTRVK